MAQTINATTDMEIVHNVVDANPTSSQVETLKIQCDQHGLSIEFPRGDILVVDLSNGVFKILKFNDRFETEPERLGVI